MEQLMYCKLEHSWKTKNRSSVEEIVVYRLEPRSVIMNGESGGYLLTGLTRSRSIYLSR